MPVSNPHEISLISFADAKEASELKYQIEEIGYSRVKISNPFEIQQLSSTLSNIVVIQVKQARKIKHEFRQLLEKLSFSRTLALFEKDDTYTETDILQRCTEISTWPCDQSELTSRMKRLAGKAFDTTDIGKNFYISLNVLGDSPVFTQLLKNVYKIAKCEVPTLIEGETGTGKEVIARAIHYLGERENKPFIPVNCGALPDSLIENELFGHESGAFTDAKKTQEGIVQHAEGGTLFLDEIEALSPKGQIVLLRFLQDLEYRPLGSKKMRKADVRVLTASNEKILDLVKQGIFRQDLFFRLNIMSVEVPTLRDRGRDIEILSHHFLQKFHIQYNLSEKYLSQKTLDSFYRYNWPGNVRELENFLHREYLLTENDCIDAQINFSIEKERRQRSVDRRMNSMFEKNLCEAKQQLIESFEVEYLTNVMDRCRGNISKAAEKAGKERRTFSKLLSKYNICKNQFKS